MTPTTSTTTTSSVTPVTNAGSETVSSGCLGKRSYTVFNDQTPFPLGDLLPEIIQQVFMQCLFNGDIKGFKALSVTNVHHCAMMKEFVNETALTMLCPKLRVLDASTFIFHADLIGIDKYKTVQIYYKLEPFVEGRAGLTIVFNQGGLTLKDMKENKCGVIVNVLEDPISEELDNVPEEDTGPAMISNAPITETRGASLEIQETRLRDEVGFDGMPSLIEYLALLIATQKEFGICLYGAEPPTFGRSSTSGGLDYVVVGGSVPGIIEIDFYGRGSDEDCAGGRLKL